MVRHGDWREQKRTPDSCRRWSNRHRLLRYALRLFSHHMGLRVMTSGLLKAGFVKEVPYRVEFAMQRCSLRCRTDLLNKALKARAYIVVGSVSSVKRRVLNVASYQSFGISTAPRRHLYPRSHRKTPQGRVRELRPSQRPPVWSRRDPHRPPDTQCYPRKVYGPRQIANEPSDDSRWL